MSPLSRDSNNPIQDTNPVPAIEIQKVRVAFRSYKEQPTSLKESVIRFVRRGQIRHYSTFDALHDVSFDIPKGKVFGILGSNGSGKSTLLKVIAQVLRPVEGAVHVRGHVASLIELGAGFDPELNAIENIYLHGSLHRKTKREIKERVDSVLEFAELADFALTPIKYYSSGMFARLGFAVAIQIDPDILLVDEILSVGDERFQTKCNGVFKQFLNSGKTVVIVSHNTTMMAELCDQVALLSKGKLVYVGDPAQGVEMYKANSYETALH